MSYTKEFAAQFVCDAPDFLPASLLERLEFLSCLSEKQTRSVYLCKDRQSGEKTVLKINDSDSPDSISREYGLLCKLSHPAIPRALLYDNDADGREYLLRSYAEGDTLDKLIGRDGVFDERRTLDIIQKLCVILAYLHKQSPPIIYRDIKPQNIVITPNGRLSLIDFGISREENGDKDFDTIYVGSVAFASPEQFGFTKTDSRSDVFALGKLMLYLCTGHTKLPDFKQTVESRSLIKLISKCTELSPDKRFVSVQKLSKAIERVLIPPTRKELLAGGIAACFVIGIGILFMLHLGRPEPTIPAPALVNANGAGFENEVLVPVLIETLMSGRPFSDCAVAVDNHHWYVPAANGKAELAVYEYDEYKLRAAYKNQTASIMAAVTKDDVPLRIVFDFADVPTAPDYLPLTLEFGQGHEVPLEVTGATEIILSGQPEGISVVPRDGGFYLMVDKNVAEPGHYTFFMESVSEFGKADTVAAVLLEKQREVIKVRTAEELMKIRDNLSGHYVLENDIDLRGITRWLPIGDDAYPFSGVLDGAGHKIIGLKYVEIAETLPHVGLFGVVKQGIIRNLIIENADFSLSNAASGGFGLFIGKLNSGLMENCASVNGLVSANIGYEGSVGGLVGVNDGVVRNCFNTTEIKVYTVGSKDRTECYAGGICGSNNGYIESCGNIGAVTGISIAGGVVGFNDMGILTRCYNAGVVKSPVFAAEYLPGGVSHLLGRGKAISYCAFEKGTAQVGASVFNGGTLLGIVPLEKADFANLDTLGRIFHSQNTANQWEYVEQIQGYPVPKGVFTK